MSENNTDIKPETAQYILKRLAEKQAGDELITEDDISVADTKDYLIKTRRVEEVM